MRLKVSNVCQLLDKSKFPATTTLNGVIFINNGNGTFTVNGTTTNNTYFGLQGDQLVCTPNKKYLICGGPAIGSWSTFALYVSQTSDKWLADFPDFGNGNVFTGADNATRFSEVVIFIAKNQTVNNLVFKPQLFDLTAMYGAGNEPTTVEQFRQDFPNEMYEYSPVCWKKFRRLKYVTETKNLCDFAHILTLPLDKQFESTGFFQIEINVEPNTQYTLSRENNNVVNLGGATYLGMDNVSRGKHPTGFWLNHELLPSYCKQQITIESNADGKLWIFFSNRIYIAYKNGQNPFGYLQLEKGSTASSYQPYGYLPLNRGKYIANKEPVQLFNKDQYMEPTSPKWGIDIIKNSDGTITLNGTATSSGNLYRIQTVALIKNHKYYIFANQAGTFANVVFTVNNLGSSDVSQGNIWTYTNDNATEGAYFWVTSGTVISNRVYKPQIFDLTAMYGAGNEPTTVAQFRADHPNEMYDYNPYNAITFR